MTVSFLRGVYPFNSSVLQETDRHLVLSVKYRLVHHEISMKDLSSG